MQNTLSFYLHYSILRSIVNTVNKTLTLRLNPELTKTKDKISENIVYCNLKRTLNSCHNSSS